MDDLIERTREHLNETPDDGEMEILNEFISLRTGLIGAGLAKTKQYANQIDAQVRTLKGNAGRLKTSKTPEDTNKTLADALGTIGNLFYLQRKMGMYVALTAAATGMDSAKQTKILQKIKKEKKRR
jgi:hypothetical protein|tara:strand:- start:42 stop:419 length:378 start_codon:yes stop_codon:yes gene_type:complete